MSFVESFLDRSAFGIYINGKWVDSLSDEVIDCINPATGKKIASIAASNVRDVDAAVSAARCAFEGVWKKTTPYDRQKILLHAAELVDSHYDELSYLDTMEMGAPLKRTSAQRHRAVAMLRFYAGALTVLHGETIANSISGNMQSYTLKEPVGVVGSIIPWNAPVISAIWKVAPAIATGCTVVLKPAEEASLSCIRLIELLEEAGVPPGVVNLVTGRGEVVGAALAEHRGVDKLSFTGSTEVGKRIIQASAGNIKRVSLELGGKSPNIVFADADLDAAAKGSATGIFSNSGQICSAGSRLYVQQSVYEEFVEKVANYGRQLKIGNGLDEDTDIGPLVSEKQFERVKEYLALGETQGARRLESSDLENIEGLGQGYFVAPTVFSNVRDDMRIATEEIFGPVLSCIPFKDAEDVLERANNTIYGLGSGIWSNNINTVQKMIRGIKAGSVWVNCYQVSDPAVPFGGYKESGYGRESGLDHFAEYFNKKSVWINTLG